MKMNLFDNSSHPADNRQREAANQLVLSYLTLRNLIGFTGILLPVVLAVLPRGSSSSAYHGFEPSISDYYYTDRGDILVVLLSVIGVFLLTYKGYTITERILTMLAGICSIGVAFVPTHIGLEPSANSVHTGSGGFLYFIAGTGWHFVFAAIFLFSLAIMSLVFFTRKEKGVSSRKENGKLTQKSKRNRVFRICGWAIIVSLVIIGIYFLLTKCFYISFNGFPVVYTFETTAVVAFGISWLTKGETLWPDGRHYVLKFMDRVRGETTNPQK